MRGGGEGGGAVFPSWTGLEFFLCLTVQISDLEVSDQFVGKNFLLEKMFSWNN